MFYFRSFNICKYCNTFCVSVYFTVKPFVPLFKFKNCRSVRSLKKNKELFIKTQAVIIAGRRKKFTPILRGANYISTPITVRFCNQLKFIRHYLINSYLSISLGCFSLTNGKSMLYTLLISSPSRLVTLVMSALVALPK